MKTLQNLPNYSIDQKGNIYSNTSHKYMSQRINEDGYKLVSLTVDMNTTKIFRVHRLVAETFIPNPDNKPEVNHIDGDKTNNTVENLEWVTSKENKEHGWETGLYKDKLENHHAAFLTNDQIHSICKCISEGMRNVDIAKEFNTNKDHISHIKRGDIWGEISCLYDFNIQRKARKSKTTVESVCKLILEGKKDKEVVELLGNVKLIDVKRIRSKETFSNISSKYF